jgi:hypothetical protein
VVSLRFAPIAAGDRLAALILENAGTGDDFGVFAGGFAYDPPTIASTGAIEFPATRRRQDSRAIASFTNTGEGPVLVGAASIAGADAASFVVIHNECAGLELGPGGACGVEIAFMPTRVGSQSATLALDSDAVNAPHAVQLAGTGLPAGALRLDPPAVDFGVLTPALSSVTREVRVENVGGTTLRLQRQLTGPGSNAFVRFDGSTCPATLEADASCRLTLKLLALRSGAYARDLELREIRTGETLAVLPLRAQINGFLTPWAGRAQLDFPLADAARKWRRSRRGALRRRGFAVGGLRLNLPGRLKLEVRAAGRVIARGAAASEPGVPFEVVARTTRAGRRVLLRPRAFRVRAELRFRAEDGRRFATGLRARLPARRR